MGFLDGVIKFFQDGGSHMYPIALAMIAGWAMVIERWIYLGKSKSVNRDAFERILPLLKKKDFNAVVEVARSTDAPIGRIVASGLGKLQQSQSREDIEAAMEEGVMEILPRLEKRLPMIATLANVAPLLGLFGTVMGLISAFEAVGKAAAAEKAALLSQSISIAMNATAFGLLAAIPLLIMHSKLQAEALEIIDSIEMATLKCLNILYQQPSAGRARSAESV
ncbi:MAG TPA: MotA/TolQ/ExbB proton channel family protein [Cellvibrionaceae bacterium]|nr:MotA/TolQ/ExbB proton channel family protein [Cellvibrionaceae bacterium]